MNFAKSPSVSFARALGCNQRKERLPSDHIRALVDVWHAVHESLHASDPLTEMTLRVISIIEILSHFYLLIIINIIYWKINEVED